MGKTYRRGDITPQIRTEKLFRVFSISAEDVDWKFHSDNFQSAYPIMRKVYKKSYVKSARALDKKVIAMGDYDNIPRRSRSSLNWDLY